jgi:hypothetical protein
MQSNNTTISITLKQLLRIENWNVFSVLRMPLKWSTRSLPVITVEDWLMPSKQATQ